MIAIITENFLGAWRPGDIESMVGGSQECVVLLAEALVRGGYIVDVFLHGPTPAKTESRWGVTYRDFSKWEFSYDTVILFKINPLPRDERLRDVNVIFWSSDVQKSVPGNNEYVKKRVCLTEYHKDRNEWKDAFVIPHGVDFSNLHSSEIKRENSMLYSSSPDRGLLTLMENWTKIKEKFPDMKLYVTYGFKIAKQISGRISLSSETQIKTTCDMLDINYLGDVPREQFEKLYKKCKYWVLPLNNADSELFCLNAVKSQYCGCIPVVYKIGALKETVGKYIDFDSFVQGNLETIKDTNIIPTFSWDEIVEKFWISII